jgi:hypothetical protein
MELVIKPSGKILAIYDEAIDLAALGTPVISRASHVEPDDKGHWIADLEPVGGPRLAPFSRRSEALAAEHTWLGTYWLEGQAQ